MGDFVQELNSKIGTFAWGPWTVALIAVTGLFFMVGLRFIPLRKLGYGFKLLFDPIDQRDDGRSVRRVAPQRHRIWARGVRLIQSSPVSP